MVGSQSESSDELAEELQEYERIKEEKAGVTRYKKFLKVRMRDQEDIQNIINDEDFTFRHFVEKRPELARRWKAIIPDKLRGVILSQFATSHARFRSMLAAAVHSLAEFEQCIATMSGAQDPASNAGAYFGNANRNTTTIKLRSRLRKTIILISDAMAREKKELSDLVFKSGQGYEPDRDQGIIDDEILANWDRCLEQDKKARDILKKPEKSKKKKRRGSSARRRGGRSSRSSQQDPAPAGQSAEAKSQSGSGAGASSFSSRGRGRGGRT